MELLFRKGTLHLYSKYLENTHEIIHCLLEFRGAACFPKMNPFLGFFKDIEHRRYQQMNSETIVKISVAIHACKS